MLSWPGGASEELAGWKVLDDSTNKVSHETIFFEIIEPKKFIKKCDNFLDNDRQTTYNLQQTVRGSPRVSG